MQPENLSLDDLGRIFFGRVPWTFVAEAVIRIAVLYGLIVVCMRLMGQRMASMSSRNELIALVSLAAAIGPALLDPARGLLPPIVVAAVVVTVQRLMARGSMRSAVFERVTQGNYTIVVRDGEIDVRALRTIALAPERVFAELRSNEVINLGAIERVYFESNGSFTVIRASEEKPGLSLVPSWDDRLRHAQQKVEDKRVCRRCGRVAEKGLERCEGCEHEGWEVPVLERT